MKNVISILVISVLVGVGGMAAARAADGPDGKALFNHKCAICHGKNGVAKKMAKGSGDFNQLEWQKSTTLEAIIKQIKEGKGKMKPYKDKFTEAQIQALAKYVKSLAKKTSGSR